MNNLIAQNEILTMNPMETAPKDGTKIIIMWLTPYADINDYDIRVAWWWWPTESHQLERGAKPHWMYVSDKHSCMSIKDPVGWMYKPSIVA